MRIGILCIATGNYKLMIQNLVNGIEKNFLPGSERTIYLFTDKPGNYQSGLKIEQIKIPPYKFPEATMLRYEIFTSRTYDCDYLYYSDVDMGFVEKIGYEFLGDIVAVRHPGFFRNACNSWERNKLSKCYIPEDKRKHYYCGGIQGGQMDFYYSAMIVMRDWISEDLRNGIIPKWHDETAWNAFLSGCNYKTEFDCSYCMPEAMSKRISWGIEKITPKILALEKDFKFMRQ